MAFGRLGMRRGELTTQHMADADTEMNLLQVEISNKQPNSWSQSLFTQVLTQGTATYTLPANLVAIRDVYMSVSSGGVSTDRILWGMSTVDYDNQPNKTQQGVPTAYWMNRLIIPTITMWQVPDGNATYTLNVRMMSQVEDASMASGSTLNLPYRFLDVFVAGLAHRMSRIYKPEVEQMRRQDYMDAWANAASQDVDDNVAISITPTLGSYFR